ncbi:MAG TPA: vWA domain-containing protein [Urbifossiella sp.]|nr:vWA domain-containing protein [Urbifossiella sp.]
MFAGRGRPIRVANLLEAIKKSPLSGRRVVVLIDPARFRPDPAHGYRWDDFADRMKALDQLVRETPGLVVVCGAGAGQRGWESEELGATALAQAVIQVLDEPGRASTTGVVTAWDLFADVRDRLAAWSGNNRPAVQTPFLLPLEDEGGRDRARGLRVASRPGAAPPQWNVAPPPSADDLKTWRELWTARADRLRLAPHSAAYAPRTWRRYEQLLLRYEAALRAGLPAVAGKLADAAQATAKDFAAPYGPVFGPTGLPASFSQALAFDAVRDPAAADPTPDLVALARADADALPPAAGDPAHRASERHLAVMVNRFYRKVLPSQPPPAAWAEVIATRVRADRAALGLPEPTAPLTRNAIGPTPPAAFSERVRPYIQGSVEADDGQRRDIEDRLFGADTPARPAAEVSAPFSAAAGLAADARLAFLVRDAAFAELPYLGRWAGATGRDPAPVIALWGRVHALDAALATGGAPGDLAADATAVWTELSKLATGFNQAVLDESAVALQTTWLSKEELLATPLPRPEDRERLLRASRQATHDLLTRPTGTANTTAAAAPAAGAGSAWGRVAAAEVGLSADDPPAIAAEHRRRAVTTDARDSRAGVAFAPGADPAQEPAAAAARREWGDLFDRLADRAEQDFWYDEEPGRGGRPYYRRVADRYREDAARLRATPAAEPGRVPPLEVVPADGDGPIWWTSERRRVLGLSLRVPAGTPAGKAVVAPRLDAAQSPLRLSPATAKRSTVEVRAGLESRYTVGLETTSEDETPSQATARAVVYYRGQRPEYLRRVEVDRRPELVVTDPGPGTAGAAFAVRADPAQPLPPVVVLLDYSGSMKEGLNGFRLPGPEDAWKAGPSKFNKLLETLGVTLAELPKGTPLRVRLFSAKDLPDWDGVVYPAPGEPGVVDWQGGDDAKLRDLMARLRRYEPSGTTPLIQSIVAAARDDFPAQADGPRTLVVLTDGADDTGRPGVPREEQEAMKGLLKNTLAATRVKVVVVQFALNDADRTVARDVFADLPGLDVPGEVVDATDAEALRRELIAAVWPRLVLTGAAGTLGKNPVSGWPARPAAPAARGGTIDPSTWYWSPPLTPGGGTYATRVAGYLDPPEPARRLPAVGLAPGDFLPLSLTRAGAGFLLRRELHADSFGPARKATRGDGQWVLSVPATGVEDAKERPRFGALAILENVPPHRRQPPVAESDPVVRQILPGAVWWNVGPAEAALVSGPPVGWDETKTVVSRVYGYPAPAWALTVEGRPGGGGVKFERAAVTAWVADTPPAPFAKFTLAAPGEGSETTVSAGGRAYRATVEPIRFAGAAEPMPCLVVRTEYPAGDPVQVRLVAPPAGARAEHRYFHKANSYTAAFGPWPAATGAAGVTVEVIRVAEVVGPPGAAVRLIPPPPAVGPRSDDYVPQPTRVGP